MFIRILLAILALHSFASAAATVAGPPPRPAEIMEIPAELREQFRAKVIGPGGTESQRLERMVQFLFDEAGLGMGYRHDATYTVAQAYTARTANCLTFTLLSVALAREAGLDAYGQEIDEILTWHQEGNLIYRTNHINAGVTVQHRRRFTVDVAGDAVIARHPPQTISDQRLLALFYNNRAAELMGAGQREAAGPYMEMSLQLDPRYATSWSNAGVLALHNDDLKSAEQHYKRALALEPAHSTTLFNLVSLYQRSGNQAQAKVFKRRLEKVQSRDPFHQFQLAVEWENKGDAARALKHYRRAIRLHGTEHRFHFGLARAYLALGEGRLAGKALARAHALSEGVTRERYHAKLDTLRSHASH